MKNILILTGSPRINGNCDILTDVFIKGAQAAGNRIFRFDAGRKRIAGCMACDKCWSKGKACVMDDDFDDLAELIPQADVIVYISPLYYSDISGQMKCAIDRFYSYSSEKALEIESIKESVMIVVGETEDITDFTGVIKVYKKMIGYKGWNNKGVLCIPKVSNKGDVFNTNYLSQVENMGKNI